MKILFVHQNFPGQFLHLAPALAERGHEVLALTDEHNTRPSPVKVMRYAAPATPAVEGLLGRAYAEHAERALMAARGARALRDRHGFSPDIIIGHPGWGETLLLREIWPEAKLLLYAELMYRTRGQDVGFDPEVSAGSDEARFLTVARNAHLVQAMVQADAAIAPTRYQADSFPPELRGKITVIHDGIDTDRVAPDPTARLRLPDGRVLTAADEVLGYVARSLEPYRGFHVFMRALPQVLAQRPGAQVVIVGGDGISYGGPPREGGSWKAKMLAELPELDLSRVHFLGRVAYARLPVAAADRAGALLPDLSLRAQLVVDRGHGGGRLSRGLGHRAGARAGDGRLERSSRAVLRPGRAGGGAGAGPCWRSRGRAAEGRGAADDSGWLCAEGLPSAPDCLGGKRQGRCDRPFGLHKGGP